MDPDADSRSDNGADGEKDLSFPEVTTKYRCAGDITNAALKLVVDGCISGADVYDLCVKGDDYINTETGKVYNKKEKGKKLEKGVAFPTCLSVNEVCGHFCPLDKDSSRKLVAGDVVKIDMGCHIDGYICVVGHTIVVGSPTLIDGRKADVMKAAWTAAEAALRCIKVGNKSSSVTKVIETAGKQFECSPVQGVMSHQMKRHVIEGNQCIPCVTGSNDDRSEEFDFELNQVYGMDIIVSTGEGKVRDSETKTTVYKRAVENKYILKSALGRHFMSEVETKFPTLPFALRAVQDLRASMVGVSEAMRHELLRPYHVYSDKVGEFVAQFKYTVLLLPGGPKKITGMPFAQDAVLNPNHQITDEELLKLLATSANPKKKKKPNKAGGTENSSEEM